MAYTPNEWECGDIVTAEKLNAMERGVAEMNAEYVPTEWKCGDIVSAEKLNHMEQGIANGGGGECDFSTAEITIICTEGTLTFPAGTPHIVNDELVVDEFEVTPNNNVILTVPLYDGKLTLAGVLPTVTSVPVTTGAVTFGSDGTRITITIEGDGTISARGL